MANKKYEKYNEEEKKDAEKEFKEEIKLAKKAFKIQKNLCIYCEQSSFIHDTYNKYIDNHTKFFIHAKCFDKIYKRRLSQ